MHSVARAFIPGGDFKPFGSGKSAFRFLVPRQIAAEDPVTKRFVETRGELTIWYGKNRRIIMYPTSENSILNFVCIHPSTETADEAGDDWDQNSNLDELLRVYASFDPAMLKLLGKAKPQSIKIWKLLDMKVIPSWTNQHLALLGDAAHPFLPHQGQGAGVAIEDAAALAVVLPLGTKPEEITERLKLYEEIRMERANRIQEFSRIAGADLDDQTRKDSKSIISEYLSHSPAELRSVRLCRLQFWT